MSFLPARLLLAAWGVWYSLARTLLERIVKRVVNFVLLSFSAQRTSTTSGFSASFIQCSRYTLLGSTRIVATLAGGFSPL